MPVTPVKIALVAMPFAPIQTPSLGLALLHGAMDARGIRTKTFNFSIPFAKHVGPALYDMISDGEPARMDLVGEWIFSGTLFGDDRLDVEGYVRDVLRGGSPHHVKKRFQQGVDPEQWIDQVLAIREQADPFLDECVEILAAHRPAIVGLTSMFEEHVAALSLARRFRAACPDAFIMIGGSNCEGPMGLETARRFPFLDAVVSGEGDIVFPEIVERVLAGEPVTGMQGVHCPSAVGEETEPSLTPGVQEMDTLPYPNFDDHFAQLQEHEFPFDGIRPPHLMFETARGCWWGQVNHCTFCGLNGATMAFRSKSPDRALAELTYLVERHPGHAVAVSDNILDHKYLKNFVPAMIEKNPGAKLFYEVKANLKKEEVRALRDAGIDRIQPGIESFSTPLLKLMHKGVSGLQNLQLLKWCRELGVTPIWGLLWGFPGEDPAEYERIAKIVPLISHLTPPVGVTQIRLDRFSPNHTNAAEWGFTNVRPFPAYGYVYPLPEEALQNLAYFFTYEYADGRDVESYTRPIETSVDEWLEVHESSALFYADKGNALIVWDLRPAARQPVYVLHGRLRDLYVACDHARTVWQLCKTFGTDGGDGAAVDDIHGELAPLLEDGLMVREADSYLSLAVPLGEYVMSDAAKHRFWKTVKELGEGDGDETVIRLPTSAEPSVSATAPVAS